MSANANLLTVDGLTVEYAGGRQRPALRAVDDVGFSIACRETVGLVGESGSGKSTIGRAILGLVPITRGRIAFAGADITDAPSRARQRLSAELQVVFQDPYSSLNPTRTIGQSLTEVFRPHAKIGQAEVDERVRAMLERVGLPEDATSRYPTHFSGGQRQRIAIARALLLNPTLVICDEPVSALDLSVQAQVLNLLRELQDELELSYLFIAHDLAVVRHLSDRIIVLFRGRVMEEGPAELVYRGAVHPYTRSLLEAMPIPDPQGQRKQRRERERRRQQIERVDDATQHASDGCPFASRCPHRIDACRTSRPQLTAMPTDVSVACHRWEELRGNADSVA